MRLIDLLNLIADNKELPDRFKLKDERNRVIPFIWDEHHKIYRAEYTYVPFVEHIKSNFSNLNNEILIDDKRGELQ